MKCSYCGHELNDGAEFCDNCGMIMGFGDEKESKPAENTAETEMADEYTPNVFEALDFDEEELQEVAMELPVSEVEETVEVSLNIPEYVSLTEEELAESVAAAETAAEETEAEVEAANEETEIKEEEPAVAEGALIEDVPQIEADFEAPEYTPVPDVVISAKKASDAIKESNHVKKAGRKKKKHNKKIYTETYNIENLTLDEKAPEETEEINEEAAAPVVIPVAPVSEEAEIQESVATESEEVAEIAAEEPEVIEEAQEEIQEVVEEAYIPEEPDYVEPVEEPAVGLFEEIGVASEEEEEYEDITPTEEEFETGKKGGKGIVIAALILVLCVLCAGAYALKDYIPVLAPTEGTSQEDSTVAPSEEETSEEESTEETTEEDTTEADETTDEATEDDTTEAEETTEETSEEITTDEDTTEDVTEVTTENAVVTTTKPSTTKPATTRPATTRPATTRPATTRPATTRPATTKPATTKPATTKPATTKPSTTKPATTKDPYGINNVTVKKPSSYITSYTGYATGEGVNMRSGPSTSYPRVLYLSKGADVKVLAKENGFLYVYSNRYGVYGWVSASYISASRPSAETSKTYTGTVKPDVSTASKVMHTTYSLNIRKGPATSYDSVQVIATGYPVKVIGYKSGVSGWVYVTDLTYGVSGWVSSAYLK